MLVQLLHYVKPPFSAWLPWQQRVPRGLATPAEEHPRELMMHIRKRAGPLDDDTLMLLYHKSTIEFMVDTVLTEGITAK